MMESAEQIRASGFVVCIRNEGYELDLEPLKIYEVVPDETLEREDIRVIDESGEDYIYPAGYFAPVQLPYQDEVKVAEIAKRRSKA